MASKRIVRNRCNLVKMKNDNFVVIRNERRDKLKVISFLIIPFSDNDTLNRKSKSIYNLNTNSSIIVKKENKLKQYIFIYNSKSNIGKDMPIVRIEDLNLFIDNDIIYIY